MSSIIEQLQRDCGYDPDGDSPIDALIDYKDALEDEVGRLLEPVPQSLLNVLPRLRRIAASEPAAVLIAIDEIENRLRHPGGTSDES